MLCPICQRRTAIVDSFLPHFVTCQWCGGHFITKIVKGKYPGQYFANKKPSLLAKISELFFSRLYENKVNWIIKQAKVDKPKILDYGCGSGKLVEKLRLKGVEAYGFEPSPGALKITREKNLAISNKLISVSGGFDLVMLWHSLEHTHNPIEVVKKIRSRMKKNAILLIAVPNADSFDASLTKEKWFHYTYPLHLIHFTPRSLLTMLKLLGFKKIRIDYFNPEYTTTGLAQSLLNIILPVDVLYSIICHRRISMPYPRALFLTVVSLLLLVVFSPFIVLFYLLELIFKKTDAMLIVASNG